MKVTVKTLDAGSEDFELSEKVTVAGLKQQILEKMGIPLSDQRLIFQGKVLKDENTLEDCGVDGKVIHLVKRPPPSQVTGPETGEPRAAGEEGGPPEGMTVQASQDMVFVGNIPVSSHRDISQVTQNIVDQIVSSLSSQGTQAQVSAEAITTDSTGAVRMTTASAQSAPTSETTPTPAATVQPETTMAETLPKDEPAAKPQAKESAGPSRSHRLMDEAQEHEAELRRKEAERNQRQLRAILSHAHTVRRCLKFATKVLDRCDRALARVAAKKRAEGASEGEGADADKWESVKPMEVIDGREAGANDGELDDKFSELDESSDDPGTLSALLYVRFLDQFSKLHSRVQPHVVEYRRNVEQETAMSSADALAATRTALTVKDFNYYIGHAYVSLSRLHVNMTSNPPRTLRLTAPRRTEVRQMIRGSGPARPEPPSGYIVDISRDGEEGEEGRERTSTRAIVNRGSGARGTGDGPVRQPNPFRGGFPGLGGLFPPGLGLADFLASRRDANEKEEEKEAAAGNGNSGGVTKSDGSGVTLQPAESMEIEEDRVKSKEESVKCEDVEGIQSKGEEEQKLLIPAETSKEEGAKKEVKDSGSSDTAEGKGKAEGFSGAAGGEGTAEGDDDKEEGDDETPQYLARLLSELITGVADPAGPHRPSKPKEGAKDEGQSAAATTDAATGESKPADVQEEKKTEGGGGAEGEGEARPRTFAERYAGPEGTTVTISAAPAPPFGIPGLPPMEGPSLSIKNPGDGAEPEMTINFPVPPAIQLLQSLLERAEERHRQRREAGETSSEESDDDEDEEAGAGGAKKPAKKPDPTKPEKAFLDEDGEIKSISDAGSLDDIGSDHEMPSEFEHPMTRMAASAMSSLHTGEHVSMLDTMAEVRSHLGAPPGVDSDDEEEPDLGKVEDILKVVSRELSAVEVMQVFKGEVKPVVRLQTGLFNYIKEKLLNGAVPTKAHREEAANTFLANVIPSLRPVEDQFPLRDKNIDFPATVHEVLYGIVEEAYDHITTEYSEKDKKDGMFATMMHQWAVHASALFSNTVRQCVDDEERFDDSVNLLISTLFPPNTPSIILSMCGDSILKEMQRTRRVFPYTPGELDHYLQWKPGTIPTPNDTHPLQTYAVERSTLHPGQPLPLPARESCPGGGGATENDEEPKETLEFPPGVPEEWMSAINKDSATHLHRRPGPQVPFSDAYLAGMPAKKRKQLDTSEARSCSAQDLTLQLLEEAMIETGTQPEGASTLEILSRAHHSYEVQSSARFCAFNLGQERLHEDSDFDQEKYPNMTTFYRLKDRRDEY